MIATLSELLAPAAREGRAVAGFNVFGLDEAVRVVAAAQAQGQPVILMTNKELVKAIPPEILGPSLRAVAQRSSVPVCVHLDHTYQFDLVYRAVAAGYTSVMYDGSQKEFRENVEETSRVVEVAHPCGVSVEGEIGSVAYNEQGSRIKHELTDPEKAARFAELTGVDAVAVSVGTVHKMVTQDAEIDHERLKRIGSMTTVPLVIHGTSGISEGDLRIMASGPVCKFNIGTLLRRAWGETLRSQIVTDGSAFDRLTLTGASLDALQLKAEEMIAILANPLTESREEQQ